MINDYLDFLEFYNNEPESILTTYNDPLFRIEYDEITKDGSTVLALLSPFSHAISALCYRDPDLESPYNQKRISQICHVSPAEVTSWKKGDRIPEKYRWFLLMVDISHNAENEYGIRLVRPKNQQGAEAICNTHLRMVKSSYEPFCADDNFLMKCVWRGYGIQVAQKGLMELNPKFWSSVFDR